MKKTTFFTLLLLTCFVSTSFAYKIEFSKYGLVDPAKAYTGVATTSPFDAEWNSSTGITDIWLSDMDGGYNGRRVFNWTLDESGGGQSWTYNGGFTTSNTSGIRALNIKNGSELIIAHEDGTISTYDRSVAATHTTIATEISSFAISGAPHHMAFDGSMIWTNTNHSGFPNSGDVFGYDMTGALVTTINTTATYIEGIAMVEGSLMVYNAGSNIYAGNPPDASAGSILKYDLAGTFLEEFQYETGDRPPFHSESLSWDGGHLWMAGYSDGKVYRMEGESGESFPGTSPVPEPATIFLLAGGLLGTLGMKRKKTEEV